MPPPHNIPHLQNSHQELSLYSHIPAARQPQILRIISGITGMLPDTSLNHHLVYRPKRPKQFGPGAGAELYYMQLVSVVDEEAAKEKRPKEEGREKEGEGEGPPPYSVRKQKWMMKLEDIPEVTRKPVTSRSVLSANYGEGDALGLMDSLGYMLQTAYFTTVSRLVHNNIIITFTKILLPPPPPPPPQQQQSPQPPPPDGDDPAFGTPFPTASLVPLDPAESWILKAAVRVQNNQDVESINAAVNELKGFRELMRGMCDLEVAERLALDTRVR